LNFFTLRKLFLVTLNQKPSFITRKQVHSLSHSLTHL
jgi:hypothetical protein